MASTRGDRIIWQTLHRPAACNPIQLQPGTLIGADDPHILDSIQFFGPSCPDNSPYIFFASQSFDQRVHYLTASTMAWREMSQYSSSVPVFVCCMSVALAVVVSMATFIITSRNKRWPLMVQLAVFYTTINVMVSFVQVIKEVERRYELGGTELQQVLFILTDRPHSIASYVSVLLLYGGQIRVAMDLYDRKFERVIARWIGCLFVATCAIIWGLSEFYEPNDTVIFALRYLFQLGLYMLFWLSVCLRVVEIYQASFTSDLWLLTSIAMVAAALPGSFFVADVSGWWVARIIDDICPFSSVLSVTVVWYWIQKTNDVKQTQASKNQLGRRLYDPEAWKFSERTPTTSTGASVGDHDDSDGCERPASAPQHKPSRPQSAFSRWVQELRPNSV